MPYVAWWIRDSRGDGVALAHAACLKHDDSPEVAFFESRGEFTCDSCYGSNPDYTQYHGSAEAIEWAENSLRSGEFSESAAIANGYLCGAHGPMCHCEACKRRKPKTHYHVTQGSGGGYLPDDSQFFARKADALSHMRWEAARWRDNLKDGESISGSMRAGRYVISRKSDPHYLGYYLELTSCDCVSCEDESEGY